MSTITKLPKIRHTKNLGPCENLYTVLARKFVKNFKVENYHINQSKVYVSEEDYELITKDAKVFAKEQYPYLNGKPIELATGMYLLQTGPNSTDEKVETGTVKLLDGWLYEREETCKTKEERCRCSPRNGSKNIKSRGPAKPANKRNSKR